jgi:hypothetical protein
MQHSPNGVTEKPYEGLEWGGNCLIGIGFCLEK